MYACMYGALTQHADMGFYHCFFAGDRPTNRTICLIDTPMN
jgi:hypothetical protein